MQVGKISEENVNRDFLSCDWGTTSFRLRWVCGSERRVIREVRENVGIKSLYEEAVRNGAETQRARADFFAGFLRTKLNALMGEKNSPSRGLPLVISGMASSSVGWQELPYAKVPFPLDGRGLHWAELNWNKPDSLGPTYLISGIATGCDMMRGEETEIIGLMAESNRTALHERCLLILPGTHSKHVRIRDGSVVDFRTYMTGELFEVLGRQSLLRASVNLDEQRRSDSLSEADRVAFQEGVRWVKDHGLAGGLFRVRTRTVLGGRPARENTWFLSGLLIGAELASIDWHGEIGMVVLAAARALSRLYALALEIIAEGSAEWMQLPSDEVERATVTAHALFLQNGTLKSTAA